MQQKVLSQIDIYTDTVQGSQIDNSQLKNDLLNSSILEKRLSDNSKDYSYQDLQLPFSKSYSWLVDYVRDHFNVDYHKVLVPKKEWGNIYLPKESSHSRHQVEPLLLKQSPDYTYIYCVEVTKNTCEFVMEYDDNRRANRAWHIPLETNKLIIFPSTQRYFISQNTGKYMNVFITVNCEYV